VIGAGRLAERRLAVTGGEIAKLSAFLRRDFLQAWSYRMAFVTDGVGLVVQATIFFYVSKMINPDVLPSYGGRQVSYIEFVMVGIAISTFLALGLSRVGMAMRQEQLMGTLESVLMTPTAPATIQIGSVVYDLLYIPLRTTLFFVIVGVTVGLNFSAGGVLPAVTVLLVFIPFVWGLGIAAAAALVTFKRSSGGVGFAAVAMTLASGAYFPLTLLPAWVATVATKNPMAVAIEAMRESLLGGAGWSEVGPALAIIAPAAAITLVAGILGFRLALRREQRTGGLGLY
jgi:ABC-2 type transport system permease protein